jgi:hypothetical protein
MHRRPVFARVSLNLDESGDIAADDCKTVGKDCSCAANPISTRTGPASTEAPASSETGIRNTRPGDAGHDKRLRAMVRPSCRMVTVGMLIWRVGQDRMRLRGGAIAGSIRPGLSQRRLPPGSTRNCRADAAAGWSLR